MLEWMQKHKKYLVITVWVSAFALVFASMVEWGGGFFTVSSDNVAKVGDIYINRKEYQRKYNEIYDSIADYMRQVGIPDDGKFIPEIEQEAFKVLVQEKLLEMLARDIGVSTTSNEILEALLNTPEFQDATRNFNKEQYENLLQGSRWTTERYEAFVAKALLQEKMQNFPIAPVSTLEMNAFISATKIKDRVVLKLLNKNSAVNNTILQITDSEVRAYWEKNADKYVEPAHYRIAYIALDINSINVDEEALQKFYKDNEGKYNGLSFKQSLAEVDSDYRKAILGFANSYMTTITKKIVENKQQFKESSVILTMDPGHITLLQRYFDLDMDIHDITLQDIPLHSLQLHDGSRDHSELILAVSGGEGLLTPLEYRDGYWIIPYVVEKLQAKPFGFEQAKDSASKDLMAQKQNEEFERIAHGILARMNEEPTQNVLSLYLSLWQEKDSVAYHQMLSLGLSDVDIRQSSEYIMQHDGVSGIVFLDSERALLFRIVKQDMPNYVDFLNITNAEDEALHEAKIRDLRSAMFEYAMKRYKVIDYRRQS